MAEGLFSRSGNTNPFGKCTEPVKTWLPPELKERFLALAAFKGGESEYLRELIMREVLGEFELMRLRVVHGSRSPGIGPESGQQSDP